METPPPLAPPPRPIAKLPVVLGFIIGAVPWLASIRQKGLEGIPMLVFACFLLPVVGAIAAVIRPSRPYGLGVLLACGLGWLVLGAICGGLFR